MSINASTTVESDSGYAQKIEAGGHQFTADEPASAGGTDTGPRPYGLLLAALGACTSITLGIHAQRKSWPLGHIHVALRHLRTDDGGERIERDVRFSAPLSEEQRSRLAEIAEKTPVTKTIKTGASILTRLL
jgi:putative redox protein